jgi:hypothetical protein
VSSEYYESLEDGTIWPVNVGGIEWTLRYGEPTRGDLLIAASVLSVYGVMTTAGVTKKYAQIQLDRARRAQRRASDRPSDS